MNEVATCGRKGIPAGFVEVETCEQPAAVVVLPDLTNDGEPLGFCWECAWFMLHVDLHAPAKPMPINWAALGWTNGELMEAFGK